MKVFTFTNFKGHYPVGTAAVVVAKNLHDAAGLLNVELSEAGLPLVDPCDKDVNITQVDTTTQNVDVLLDGNY